MSSDPFGAIGSMLSGVVQQVEQNVENGLGGVMKEIGGGGSSSKGISGGGFLSDSMDNFSLGGMFGANGNGFAGELFGSIFGQEFGILGGIFAGNSDHAQLGNGYANGSNPGTTPHISPCGGDQTPPNTHAATPGGTPTLDPRIDQEIASLETLMANFDKYSTNGTMTKADLQKAAYDSSNPDLQKAAQFLLANPDVMQWSVDSHGQQNVNWDHLYNMDQTLQAVKQQYGGGTPGATPPATNVGGSTGTGDGTISSTSGSGSTTSTTTSSQDFGNFGDLIANLEHQLADAKKTSTGSTTSTSSSKEESLAKLDDQIGGYQSDIEKQMGILANPASTDAQRQAAQTQIQLDTMNMQRDLDAIKQLFEMLSNMEKAYSDICMNAISNMR